MEYVTAIYEGGVFRPESPIDLAAGTSVRVMIPQDPEHVRAQLMERYPNSIGVLDKEDADEISNAIESAFRRIDPHAWE